MLTSLQVEPVSRSWVSDAIVEQLRRQIVEGKLKEGDRLPAERELATLFGVGRTSIREAIKALCAMGLVQRDRKGTVVSTPGPTANAAAWQLLAKRASLRDLFEARRMIEIRVAQLAAERASEEDIEEMEAALDLEGARPGKGTDDRAELSAFIKADAAFHTAVAAAAGNVVLYELYVAARDMIFRSHRIYEAGYESGQRELVMQALGVAREDHRRIVEAISAQDTRRAGEAVERHLTSMEHYVSQFT